jgi:predicted lactoylglutathione lyase
MSEQPTIPASNLAATRRFYDAIAAPLGLGTLDVRHGAFAVGRLGAAPPMLWIGTGRPQSCTAIQSESPDASLISFNAETRAAVDAFHDAALAAGGQSLQRPSNLAYQPGHYAAFVRDPSGNAVEACHAA